MYVNENTILRKKTEMSLRKYLNDNKIDRIEDDQKFEEEVLMNLETEEIEQSWKHFLPGTHRADIWYWFEEQFDISVAGLMGQ